MLPEFDLARPVPGASLSVSENLLTIRSAVDFDGAAADFRLHFTNQHPFVAHVPFVDMPAIFSEIRHAVTLMVNRRQALPDRGAAALLELCATALRPAIIQILVDPLTADRLFLFQFEDHAPISLRISPLELEGMLQDLAAAIARSKN